MPALPSHLPESHFPAKKDADGRVMSWDVTQGAWTVDAKVRNHDFDSDDDEAAEEGEDAPKDLGALLNEIATGRAMEGEASETLPDGDQDG